jgi:transcriptional regulator GlxA family with amidase domain
MPVGDIAFACGFLDVTSFYRSFRAAYDTTPNAFREQRRKMQT